MTNVGDMQSEIERIRLGMTTGLIQAGEEAADLAQRHPDSFAAQMLSGFVYHRQRNSDGALWALDRARHLQPENHLVHFNLAMTYRHTGQLERALHHFLKSTERAPTGDLHPLLACGLYQHRVGEPLRAIPHFLNALKRRKNHSAALYGLIRALWELGRFARAEPLIGNLQRALAQGHRAISSLLGTMQLHDFNGWLQFDDKARMKVQIDAFRQKEGRKAFPHTPETFVMPDEFDLFLAEHHERARVWIVKPNNLHNGHGLCLIDDPAQAPREDGWVIQEYVPNPFLFLGRKVSFRVMLVISSCLPPRIYLFEGGSGRFALMPYEGLDRETWDRLPMHVGHKGIFSDQEELLSETARISGNEHHVWTWGRMREYIAAAGKDPDLLWARVRRLAEDVGRLIVSARILDRQIADHHHFAYGLKFIALDILIDENMKPWLMEIERGPTFNRVFDGERTGNPYFDILARMIGFSLIDPDENVRAQERALQDYDSCASRIQVIEHSQSQRLTVL